MKEKKAHGKRNVGMAEAAKRLQLQLGISDEEPASWSFGVDRVTRKPIKRRVDARDIKAVTGFTLAEIARFIGVKSDTLEKRSAAPKAQPGLTKLAHGWKVLQTLFPSDEAIRTWVRQPLRSLGGKTPKWLLEEHGVAAFVAMVEEMIDGGHG
ncbi:MAG TPA: antitoxin Xre/MbcA/ParS toxin-binding domain-containing protein [Candidatus Acidoferrales bacterium]|nr:antitoxin Xre/MbcA/ParS toxin-binding domain-containing protein [Candidatus Acidoferrales bacterium]